MTSEQKLLKGERLKGTCALSLIIAFALLIPLPYLIALPGFSSVTENTPRPDTRGAVSIVLERPRLALPVIRIPGETFEIWIRGEGIGNSSIFNASLEGYGTTYFLPVTNVSWTAERWKLAVRLANDTPVNLYDLQLRVDGIEEYQIHAVYVVREYKKRFKFVQITDVHIDDKNSVANFQKAVREINLINPELVMITGDNYDADPTGSNTPDQQQADMFMNICRGFNVPAYAIDGNHEYSYRDSNGINVYTSTINPLLDYSFNYGDHHFICASCGHWQRSAVPSVPHPDNKVECFTDGQMEWLTGDVMEHQGDAMRLLFEHAPLKTDNGKQTPMWHVGDVDDLMKQYDVKAFISGHTHIDQIIDADDNVLEGDWERPNYPICIQTNTGGAKDTVEECGYRVFMIDNDTFEYYTYDDDGDGKRSAIGSTPLGLLHVDYRWPEGGDGSSIEYTVTNDQNEDLLNGRVVLNMATPPEGIDYCVEGGEIVNVVDTVDSRIVHVRLSVPKKSRGDFSVFQKDLSPPIVSDIYSVVDGNISGIYERGSQVEIIVQEAEGEPGLFAALTIKEPWGFSVIINASMADEGSGCYSFIWDTTDALPGENYSITVQLTDDAGNSDDGSFLSVPPHLVTIRDTTAPEIFRIGTSSGEDSSGKYPVGFPVRIIVEESDGEEGLYANVSIEFTSGWGQYNKTFPMAEDGGGFYSLEWDTNGLPDGDYRMESRLTDRWGNIGNKPDPYPDIVVTLLDIIPPKISSVETFVVSEAGKKDADGEYSLGDIIHFLVVEASFESNLTGEIILRYSENEESIARLPLAELHSSPGHYNSSWESRGRDTGSYSVDVVLSDRSGNSDGDGVPGDPDKYFTLMDLVRPEVISTSPENGDVGVSISVKIIVEFSEPVIEKTLLIGVELCDIHGNEIPMDTLWYGENLTAVFTPSHTLSYDGDYLFRLADEIQDRAGNPLEEMSVTFTTREYIPKESVDASFTAFPSETQLDIKIGESKDIGIIFLGDETRMLPLYYCWYLDNREVSCGTNESEFLFVPDNLSIDTVYELKVTVTGKDIFISYLWRLSVSAEDTGGSTNGADREEHSGDPVAWWAYASGALVVILGIVMMMAYLMKRRRIRENGVESSITTTFILDEGKAEWVKDIEGDTLMVLEPEEIIPPRTKKRRKGGGRLRPPGRSGNFEIMDVEPMEVENVDSGREKGNSEAEDRVENLRNVVDEFIHNADKG